MSKNKSRFSAPETQRLAAQRIEDETPDAEPAADHAHMLVVHKTINKAYQRITEGLPVRVPTDVVEFIEERIYDKQDRITVLYRCLELGAEELRRQLEKGDVIIRYGRRERGDQ